MNKSEIAVLKNIIMGFTYSESIINKAIVANKLINLAVTFEVEVCLRALRGGRSSYKSRQVLEDFAYRLVAV